MTWQTKKLEDFRLKRMNDLLDSLQASYKKLASGDNKRIQAIQRFNEFLLRLENRFFVLLKVENEIFYAEPERLTRPMQEIQLDFVDKVEGFYQQLYASLSAFAMLLNHLAPPSFKRSMPIGEIKKFLDFLGQKHPAIKEHILWLEKARDFRGKFVDHIQQHTLHDWITYSYPSKIGPECVVIYFIKKGPEVYHRGLQLNPYDFNFQPPVNYKSFYVSPPHKECLFALQLLIGNVINNLAVNYEN